MRGQCWRGLPLILTSIPVLLLTPFPTQDGPAHLYAGHVIRHLGSVHYPAIDHAFEWSASALSTWTVHETVSLLLGAMPSLWVETFLVLAFVGGLFWHFLFVAEDTEACFFPQCALPLFAMSFVLRMGFYSFCLSMPVALHTIALWTRDDVGLNARRLLVAGCLLAILPFLHILTAGWTFVLLGAASIASAISERRVSLREFGILAVSSLPLLAVAARYPEASTAYTWERIGVRVAGLMAGGAFAGEGALWWSALPSLALLTLGALFLRDEQRNAFGAGRAARRRLVVVVVALLLALLMPEDGAGGAYIGVRCNLLFFLLLLVVLKTWRLPARLDAALALTFLAFSLVHLSRLYVVLRPASMAEREISDSAALLHDHTKALVVTAGDWMEVGTPTLATQTRPLLHAGDLLGVGADRTILSFYEGELSYFPVNFKRTASPFGALFDRTLYGWTAPGVRWAAVPTWQGGVDYVGVWDEPHLLQSADGARFKAMLCAHYEEVYRSASRPWVIYHLVKGESGTYPAPAICGG
ncbi:MAG: hypothetical protein HYR72_19115 [Deltaproteobacteria bacterium]|nr:hypothetical protein [Deltaproteobacteria bacterium]MBI3386171.1 hypothetical protein [Deltaproteobacteria bacterium]